jgi:hypothetical protein
MASGEALSEFLDACQAQLGRTFPSSVALKPAQPCSDGGIRNVGRVQGSHF